jgi:hypothetical protein
VLARYPDRDVAVGVVWFPMVRTDARDRWPRNEIVDARARHFWDENKLTGKALAAREELARWRPVAWDVWLLYPPGVTWDAEAPVTPRRGRTIIGTRDELDDAVAAIPKGMGE